MTKVKAQQYATYWNKYYLESKKKEDARRMRFRESALDIARRLCEDHGASKVLLFGSVIDSYWLPDDIDLAVEGLSDEDFYKAVFDVQGIADCRVDVVAIEDLPARFRQHIYETGEILYESS
ncbi:MAG: nucleotidyltransferase domain-containing protein [Desulfobacterales bacterium]|nr:nucleotidyltransferase domain-containing protein [Desulfobacterales bacterium]